MASNGSSGTNGTAAQLLQFGKERADAMFHAQQEERLSGSRAGMGRQAEVGTEIWSELAGKLRRSDPCPKVCKHIRTPSHIACKWRLKITSVCWRIARK